MPVKLKYASPSQVWLTINLVNRNIQSQLRLKKMVLHRSISKTLIYSFAGVFPTVVMTLFPCLAQISLPTSFKCYHTSLKRYSINTHSMCPYNFTSKLNTYFGFPERSHANTGQLYFM